jgi:hypothetical protein
MIQNLTLDQFISRYYDDAARALNKIVYDYVQANKGISPYIDLELVKQLTIIYSLEKVYLTYDVDREGAASLHTYLNKVMFNCFRSELMKQWTQVKRNHPEFVKVKDKVREDMTSPAVITAAKVAGVDGIKREAHTYMDAYGVYERKEEVIDRLMECIKKLNPADQVILDCWMHEKRNYVAASLERLGIENTARSQSMIRQRFDRIKDRLAKMLGGSKPDYRDIYIPRGEAAKDAIKIEPVERNVARRRARAVKKEMSAQIDYKKIAEKLCNTDI